MKRLIPILALLVLLPSSSPGFGYLSSAGAGTPLPGFTARSVASGGLRSLGLEDGSSILTNPAGMSGLTGPAITLSIGPGIGREFLLDSLGEHESNWLSLSTLFAGVSFPVNREFSAGAALAKVTDISYDFSHYLYDFQPGQTSYLSEIRELSITGSMYEAVGGISYSAARWLDLGLSAGMRFGSASYDSSFVDVNDHDNDTLVTWKRDFSSFCWHAGMELPLEFARIGLSWASEDDDYPARAAIGGLLYTDEARQGGIGAEVELGDPGGRNSTDVKFFGYGFLSPSLRVLGALTFGTPNYENVDTETRMALSLGTSLRLGKVELDTGFAWSSMTRGSYFLVPGEPEELKESFALISLGFTWRP